MAKKPDYNFTNSFITGVSGLVGSIAQSEAIKAQGIYANTVANVNARFSEMQAREAIKRGDADAAKHGKSLRGVIGQQRASFAAQGIEISSGSALEIQEQTREIGLEEVETIRNNAWRQALGFKQAAQVERAEGALALSGAAFESGATLVAGGLGFARDLAGPISEGFGAKEKKPKGTQARAEFDPAKYGAIERTA